MPYAVDFKTLKADILEKPLKSSLDITFINELKIVYDTEFTNSDRLKVDSVQLYLPQINYQVGLSYQLEELNDNFNPISYPLKDLGIDAKFIDDESLRVLLAEIYNIYENSIDGLTSTHDIKITFQESLDSGLYDEILSLYNLNREQLICKRQKDKTYHLEVELPKLTIELLAFFADVDLFKIIGKNWQPVFLEASLESRRVIKTSRGLIAINPLWIDGKLYEIGIRLRDAMNRFPVLSGRGLDNQCKVYQAETTKINIETEELATKLGLKSTSDIKANMSLLRKFDPVLFALYGCTDVLATDKLSEKHQELLDNIRGNFGLDTVEVKDTTGSNVAKFINDLYHKHFNPDNDKDRTKTIQKYKALGQAKSIQNAELNDFGIQPLRTVGGLLYTRCQRYPYIKGLLGDLDMSSCYATRLCSLTIFLGQPVITTYKEKKYKPTLREWLKFIKKNSPRDGWIVRVSGKLTEAINTIILSDLDFKPKQVKFKTVFDIDPGRKSINLFNAFKVSNKEAESTLLTKEIKFGLINADLWDCIKLLPKIWIDEYLDLLVDCAVFVPNEMICQSVDELEARKPFYPQEPIYESTNDKGCKINIKHYCQDNLCLAFPIGDYYQKLKSERSAYKKQGNPIQEVYKLFLNSGYGALACENLPVNNLLAANQITASPRATAWLMINALNGFQVITDGCTFNWKSVPVGLKFKDIIENNPDYLLDYQPAIESRLAKTEINQDWVEANFIQHLHDFYDVGKSHVPSNRYGYELKDELFKDNLGNDVKTTLFTEFYNTGSGNYCKGLDGQHILIDGTEYDFSEEFKKVKARSFKGSDSNLLNWYLDCLKNGYREPVIYSENQIIKFGEGNREAIKFLESGIDRLAHPMGFSRKVFKIMKLITRSQFLFQNEKQLRNFERVNQLGKLDNLSKNFLTYSFWKKIKLEDLEPYGVTELISSINYYNFAKAHTVGVGFELLAVNNSNSKSQTSIESVRNLITDSIKKGNEEFNSSLNLDRHLDSGNKFKLLFAALIVLRANEEYRLKTNLIESANEPTIVAVTPENICRFSELLSTPEFS
ncbi:hypothetical protein Sta7437_4987 (plasmid) [Stanieria cyanosphaera PCC 7437]|uniref:DNA-directed DNA polymerase n=1 Tax=Stanieria cyanosphaera (strain ATCC 29371 / PCC 7437) TaxID=111780 RepID=K9Y2Z5_STAC7|nr:hypothetical protein [Stanieria cyanosphaera]AFZ38407.1 hypothetical protein Sta7437_4987 [Stanieria cyanosphaera PCC 7437]